MEFVTRRSEEVWRGPLKTSATGQRYFAENNYLRSHKILLIQEERILRNFNLIICHALSSKYWLELSNHGIPRVIIVIRRSTNVESSGKDRTEM